ncbi:MAG: hypothetical protein FD155_1738 [Bacteroidetes bacterium]|nr:MAG: hypothetical protein FD155_1738 [Bacteroidota bacterium]
MILIEKNSNDPYFNVAAEEFVVKHIQDEVFMLWKNNNCLVVGKHQNTIAELNYPFLHSENIPVVRRISGGGTVFQGVGNINYSFITNAKEGEEKINFKRFTHPVLQFLSSLGVNAELMGKSSLAINGLKFSGNAAHVHRNRSLHHGTMLFDADLHLVNKSIEAKHDAYQSKAILSNRAEIANIRPYLHHDLKLEDFESAFKEHICNKFNIDLERSFTNGELEVLNQMVTDKYSKWEWNFGYSPDYSLKRDLQVNDQKYGLQLIVSKGIIQHIQIIEQPAFTTFYPEIFIGLRHSFNDIYQTLIEKYPAFGIQYANQIAFQLL